MAKARLTILAMLAALAAAVLALGGVAFAQQEGTTASDSARLDPLQEQKLAQGYLPIDPQRFEQAKAEAAEEARNLEGEGAAAPAGAATTPETLRSWEGIRDRNWTPSDSTSAIGPTRYIQLVNSRYAIYDRTGNNPIAQGLLGELAGESVRPIDPTGDPQIIWDDTTDRFYFATLGFLSERDTRLEFGWSKTASPSSADDFCNYRIKFGSRLPDYPKLGDTEGLLLVGYNSFDLSITEGDPFVGSELMSVAKPEAGSNCPRRGDLTVDFERNLKADDGSDAVTPVPANQIDTGETGYVVAEPGSIYDLFVARSIEVFEATERRDGTLRLRGPRSLGVSPYYFPANAPQPETRNRLDTLDARMTQAVLAKDPARGGKLALWTQHTIMGGSGAVVRWYEIDPAVPEQLQRGTVMGAKPGDYTFNGAISPDRQVNGDTERFGSNMVLGFSTSSVARFPQIRMVSKVGNNPVSAQVLIKSSSLSLTGRYFECEARICRWGDYSGATPDPAVPGSASTGRVWLTNQWVKSEGSNRAGSGWGTWNWISSP